MTDLFQKKICRRNYEIRIYSFVFSSLNYSGNAHGSHDTKQFIMENPVVLNNGSNNISLLSVMVGLPVCNCSIDLNYFFNYHKVHSTNINPLILISCSCKGLGCFSWKKICWLTRSWNSLQQHRSILQFY